MSEEATQEAAPTEQVTPAPTNVSPDQPNNAADTKPADTFTVPEAYKTASWAGKVKSIDDVYKQLDNLDKLAGKKAVAGIDYSTAKPEEIQAYHDSLAAKDISAYGFGDNPNEAAIGNAFKKAGLNEHQGKALLETLTPFFSELDQKTKAELTSEEGYVKLAQEAFGDGFKEHIGKVEKTLKTYAPDDATKQAFDEMPNATRIVVDKTVAKIVEAYESRIEKMVKEYGIKETGAQAGSDAGSPGSIEQKRTELRTKIRELGMKPGHTYAEKQALVDQLNATYKQ
jgi:hypothetical protein